MSHDQTERFWGCKSGDEHITKPKTETTNPKVEAGY